MKPTTAILFFAPLIASASTGKPRYSCEVHQFSDWAKIQTLEIGAQDANSAPLLIGPYKVVLSGYPSLEFLITVSDPRVTDPEKSLVAQAAGMDGVPLALSAPIADVDVNCRPIK